MSNKKQRFQRRLKERQRQMEEASAKEPSLPPQSRRDRIQAMLDSRRKQ